MRDTLSNFLLRLLPSESIMINQNIGSPRAICKIRVTRTMEHNGAESDISWRGSNEVHHYPIKAWVGEVLVRNEILKGVFKQGIARATRC
jgi:hypothetical protein